MPGRARQSGRMTGKDDARPGPSVRRVPDGDTLERLVCPDCGFVQYDNPKIVVGAVACLDDRVLLCRRAINPRDGYWTLPAGYMELNETATDGAAREAWEEARARLDITGLLAVYNIPRISQVQLIYRARLVSGDVSAGPESREVGLFRWDDIPWDDLAFPSVRWALHHWREVGNEPVFAPRTNPPGDFGDYGE
jgi:ADP-ribose pyrophosphatase YjhB (NUDIX family)